jgi:hypothetical protein
MPVLTGQSLANSEQEIAKANRAVLEYVEQVERENVISEPEKISEAYSSEGR